MERQERVPVVVCRVDVGASKGNPLRLESQRRIVSYSDAEGAAAGVGVAFWCSDFPRPQAAVLNVPLALRSLWAAQRERARKAGFFDIQEIEAIGPYVLLRERPEVFYTSLWLPFDLL